MNTWSEAFGAQAAADLDAYELLSRSALPQCHRLHYLQMWLEKLCKAYVHRANPEQFKRTHNLIAKILPRLIDEHWRRIGFERPPRTEEIRKLCREIDLLHPGADDSGRRPENAEYPWAGLGGEYEAPARWKFTVASRLDSNSGRLLLKASNRLTRNSAILIQ